jgi:hypothetical protein
MPDRPGNLIHCVQGTAETDAGCRLPLTAKRKVVAIILTVAGQRMQLDIRWKNKEGRELSKGS